MSQNIMRRRKIRALEAQRDTLKEKKAKATEDLAKVSAALKHARSN